MVNNLRVLEDLTLSLLKGFAWVILYWVQAGVRLMILSFASQLVPFIFFHGFNDPTSTTLHWIHLLPLFPILSTPTRSSLLRCPTLHREGVPSCYPSPKTEARQRHSSRFEKSMYPFLSMLRWRLNLCCMSSRFCRRKFLLPSLSGGVMVTSPSVLRNWSGGRGLQPRHR